MAQVRFAKPPPPTEIEQFLGLNETFGNTQIKPGELSFSENFRFTKNFKMSKRPGHHTFIDFGVAQNVQGVWQGRIAAKDIMLSVWDGNVYEYDMSIDTDTTAIADLITETVVTIIGTLTDLKTQIFWFNGKIYFRNGVEYKEYDGTTYQDVVPYIPTIALNALPAGGGTLFEEINLLTGAKIQTFIGDGASTLYQLAEADLDADLLIITVDGVTKTETVDFTVNRTLGQVTFTVAPVNEALVSIQWVKVVVGNEDLVLNHKYAVDFGIDSDTNLFIFGNENEKRVFRFSGINKAGYYPANSFVAVGSDEFSITDLKSNQQSLLIFKERATFVVNPTINSNFADNTGLNPYNFGYKDLNEQLGHIAPNMVQLIKDSPISLDEFSMWLWKITSVESQRSADVISDRLQRSLQELDLSMAVTFNYANQKEYWVNVGTRVYIWNYDNDTMYIYTNIQATEFITRGEDVYYASLGTVEHMNESFLADGSVLGDTIPCIGKLAFSDYGALQYEKSMQMQWLSIEPASRASVDIQFVTDRKNEEKSKTYRVEYILMDFNNVDFNAFSFLTNINPQSKPLNATIDRFVYLQPIFKNDTNNETLTILKLSMLIEYNRFS